MSPLAFSFDIEASDYAAMCTGCWTWRQWLRATVPSAGVVYLFAFFFFAMGHMDPDWAFVASAIAALAYLVVSPPLWRLRYGARVRRYYAKPPADKLLGPHTLTIGPEGIESTGPYHRTFRSWPSITSACVTKQHFLIDTIYGNVYILPVRSVADTAEVRRALEAHLPAGAIRGV